MGKRGRLSAAALILMAALMLTAACAAKPTTAGEFPEEKAVPGWTLAEKQSYTRDTLFNLVDGQAESFLAYGFQKVDVQHYQNTDGNTLNMEIWRLTDAEDAYGLFTFLRTGKPVAVGVDGESDGRRRLAFWQGSVFVQITTGKPVSAAELERFARPAAEALPKGGSHPALVDRLPQDGLDENGWVFFHNDLPLQNELWLGGQNLLGLSDSTDGVTAHYSVDGTPVQLLLVEYPTEDQSLQALKGLQAAGVPDLLVSGTQGRLLGAVFGKEAAEAGVTLLEKAMKP